MTPPTIGLSLPQIQHLRALADRLQATPGQLSDQGVWLARFAGIYFGQLATDAATEKLPRRNAEEGISTRVMPEVRLSTLRVIQNTLCRDLLLTDLLNPLRALDPVDDAVATALQQDIGRLGGYQP
jgi:hypothetical protein